MSEKKFVAQAKLLENIPESRKFNKGNDIFAVFEVLSEEKYPNLSRLAQVERISPLHPTLDDLTLHIEQFADVYKGFTFKRPKGIRDEGAYVTIKDPEYDELSHGNYLVPIRYSSQKVLR